jgi:hypothetical protein
MKMFGFIQDVLICDNEIYYLKSGENSVGPKPVIHETASLGSNKFYYPFKYLFNYI